MDDAHYIPEEPWVTKYTAGRCHAVDGQHAKAVRCYSEAERLAPGPMERHEVLTAMLKSLYAQRDDAEVAVEFEECCRRDMQLVEANLEDVFAGGYRWGDAVNPTRSVESFSQLAIWLERQGRYSEAVSVCVKAMELGVRDGTVRGYEGRLARVEKKAKAGDRPPAKPKASRRPTEPQPQVFHSKIAGHHVPEHQTVIQRLTPGVWLTPVRRPDNPHDPNAIRLLDAKGDMVGHITANAAETLAPLMDLGWVVAVVVNDMWGSISKLGANLIIFAYPPEQDAALRPQLAEVSKAIRGSDRCYRATLVSEEDGETVVRLAPAGPAWHLHDEADSLSGRVPSAGCLLACLPVLAVGMLLLVV